MLIKIKCPTEFCGVLYAGVVLASGVDAAVGQACDPLLGNVMTFSVKDEEGQDQTIPSPILFVSAIQSISIGDEVPPEYLVLTPGV